MYNLHGSMLRRLQACGRRIKEWMQCFKQSAPLWPQNDTMLLMSWPATRNKQRPRLFTGRVCGTQLLSNMVFMDSNPPPSARLESQEGFSKPIGTTNCIFTLAKKTLQKPNCKWGSKPQTLVFQIHHSPSLASPRGRQGWMKPGPRPLSGESQTEERPNRSSPRRNARAGPSPQTESLPQTGAVNVDGGGNSWWFSAIWG